MPKPSPRRRAATALASVVLVSALGACATDGPDDLPAETSAAAAPSPEPTLNAGDPVTPDQELPDGVKAFTLADGSAVAVVADQPLPDAVVAQLVAEADVASAAALADPNPILGYIASQENADRLEQTAAEATGKSVVVLFPIFATMPDEPQGTPARVVWATKRTGETSHPAAGTTVDEGRAAADAIVAEQPDPQRWAVLTISD